MQEKWKIPLSNSPNVCLLQYFCLVISNKNELALHDLQNGSRVFTQSVTAGEISCSAFYD